MFVLFVLQVKKSKMASGILFLSGSIIELLLSRWGVLRGVMIKETGCGSEFELQSHYDFHFQTNTLGKGMNTLILPAMGLNSNTSVLQEEWLWY